MRKMVLMFAAVMLLTAPAHALPLQLTQGAFVSLPIDAFGDASEDGVRVIFSQTFGFFDSSAAFEPNTATVYLREPTAFAFVTVGNESCSAIPGAGDCGFINLSSPGFTETTLTAPFIATGHLNVGAGFDVVGQGILTGSACLVGAFPCGVDTAVAAYTFNMPESPTVLLLVASFVAFFGVRFLRERHRKLAS